MEPSLLLSPQKKKESVKNLLSYLGVFAGAATVFIFSALFFTDVSFTAAGTVSFSLSFLLLFVSAYMMYASLFETGRSLSEREESFLSLSSRRDALFARLHAEGSQESLSLFCKNVSDEETKLFKLLSQSVEVLDLSVRAMNCLNSANIKLVSELCTKTESRMLKYRNFGKKSLDEIKEKIEKIGLELGMNLSDRLMAALDAESARVRAEGEETK